MTRITPSSGSTLDLTVLEDDEPYKGILKKPKDGWMSPGALEYGGEDRLTIDWELEDKETLRDWISLRLGKQQNGTVSKLRMLLNALSDKPRDTEVKWFDSETLEWGYDDKAYNKVSEGMEVVFRGIHGTKQDGSGKFTIQKYQTVKAKAPAAAGKKNAPRDVDPNDVPF